VWSVSLDRVRTEAPAAEALLNLCAFLAPEGVPRGLPTERPELLPDQLATAVGDGLSYNRVLAAVGRYSLAAVTPVTIALHRLVQAVIQARLTPSDERLWAEIAVNLLRANFPNNSWEINTWATCERLLPHLLTATGHAQRLQVAGEAAGWLLHRASIYLRGRGQYRQAKPIAEQALTLTQATLGPNHPEVAWRHDGLGRVLRKLGEPVPARQQQEQALAITEATLGPNHPDMGTWRNNLGRVLRDMGDLTGARQQYEQALAITEAALGPDHPNVGIVRSNLDWVLQELDADIRRGEGPNMS
jgi:tetratricopeptide (TPR) repeat protein